MSVNEGKVKAAIAELERGDSLSRSQALYLLHEAIAPPVPEIPEGCPVLVGPNTSEVDTERFYTKGMELEHTCCEIDYQRKGHVIPWGGGECPVDGNWMVSTLSGGQLRPMTDLARCFDWSHESADILAYVIWPEWIKP